ncbi:hypothetical protein HPP92_003809 [Vanilla planifolia]|uniref:Uncharacterized protein n=1 Tax=Vanilla planifolia TaxID=51239 RepID=A0A835VJA0_VANPL|nr:hypothetical protein HPP92_003809 [Vanilla planifolia]
MKIPKVHQSTALPWPSPLMISGARYSWVPTKDMDRASLGSAMSSGNGLTWFLISAFAFRDEKRGEKQVVVTAGGLDAEHGADGVGSEVEERMSVGLTVQRRRGRSRKIMWLSSRTRTFSA